ncbi:MAG TPA: hypothetical protein VK659_14660, partial [Asanoa sp.]|nr:hypothetical protein [Asanoa sp.]
MASPSAAAPAAVCAAAAEEERFLRDATGSADPVGIEVSAPVGALRAPTSDLVARVRDPAFGPRAAGPAPAPRPDADAAGPESEPAARLVLFPVPV